MALVHNTVGCGMYELSALNPSDEKGMMIDICKALQTWTGDRWNASDPKKGRLRTSALILYTATIGGGYDNHGKMLESAITKFGLGTVTKSRPVNNDLFHNGRKAIAYIWELDKPALEKWWEQNMPDSLKNPEGQVKKVSVPVPEGLAGFGIYK